MRSAGGAVRDAGLLTGLPDSLSPMEQLFLVLMPGNHMFKVIEAAHRRGLKVAVFHSGPVSPPAPYDQALPFITHLVPIDNWRNIYETFKTIVAWCGERPVFGTYAGYEITLRIESLLRQHYKLPGNTLEKIDFLLNKARVRTDLQEASLTRLRLVEEQQLRQLTEWPFPGRAAFLKPVNGSGSAYVRRCRSLADAKEHLSEWDGYGRRIDSIVTDHLKGGHGLFLEEEAVGELLSLEGYNFRGRYVPIGITDRTVLSRDTTIEMGNTFPCPHPRFAEIVRKVEAIHQRLGITHGATHTELIVPDGDGEIELVELNLRFAGGDILILIDHAFGIAFEDDLVRLAMGDGPLTNLPARPVRYAAGQDFLAPENVGCFKSIEIPGDDVFFRKIVVKPGTDMKSTNFQFDHVAAFVVGAETYSGALARANEIRAATTINGLRLGNNPNNVVINYGERWTVAGQ